MVDWNRIVRNLGRGTDPMSAYREAEEQARRERAVRYRHAGVGRYRAAEPSKDEMTL